MDTALARPDVAKPYVDTGCVNSSAPPAAARFDYAAVDMTRAPPDGKLAS